ncbi:hypothetical protein SLA2020_449050 [Shorea laevis]
MVGLSNVSCRKRDRSHGHGITATNTTTTISTAATTSAAKTDGNGDRDLSECLKTKLMELGKDLWLQRSPSVMKKQRCQRRRKLKEEEQAAVCLMALSCDSVFA